VAKKQDNKASTAKAEKAGKSSGGKSAGGKRSGGKGSELNLTRSGLETATDAITTAPAKAKKALKSAKTSARDLVPSAPSIPTPNLPDIDVSNVVKEIGSQIMAVLNSTTGRVIVAEILIHLAKSLTAAAANSDTGKDVKDSVLNAGAKIGAAVATAGAQMMEGGTAVASSGAEAASGAAGDAKDLAQQVAQVAVGAVGGVIADAASKVMGRRGKKNAEPVPSGQPASSGTASAQGAQGSMGVGMGAGSGARTVPA
jgi:hypothetical protein